MTVTHRRGWHVVEKTGTAQELHDLDVADGTVREVWVCRATAPAVVLGSTQPDETVDESARLAAGVHRARRRSGGGAVLVGPDDVSLWVDLVVPRGDPLWSDDVGLASHWVGEAWCEALRASGMTADVHRDAPLHRPWSDLVCFAGVGPGEVLSEGRKVVGLAQRRTRAGARFQTMVLRRWRPGALLDLLSLGPDARVEAAGAVGTAAVGTASAPDDLLETFLGSLPAD